MDVGVGTGYFLARCTFPSPKSRLILVDANANSLAVACRRLQRLTPHLYQRNILLPLELPETPVRSIAVLYLLHCLPEDITAKARVFDLLSPYLRSDGVLFGATILGGEPPPNRTAAALMRVYQARGIFSNADDRLDPLRIALEERYADVSIETRGCVALFAARGLKHHGPKHHGAPK